MSFKQQHILSTLRKIKIALFFFAIFVFAYFVFTCPKQKNFPQKKVAKSGLPKLAVNKNRIIRQDNKKPVKLKGVTSMAFVYYHYRFEDVVGILNEMKKWKINLLGLFINPDNFTDQQKTLDEIINWSLNNQVYVYLMPAVNIHDPEKPVMKQVGDFAEMMEKLSGKYKNHDHILYGLWAEPRHIIWHQWKTIAKDIADRIYFHNPEAVILLTGVQFGRIINDDYHFKNKNIIYDYHDYPSANQKELIPILNNKTDFFWSTSYKDYPVLIGEWGGVYEKDFSCQEDLEYIAKVIKNANKLSLNYSAYTIDEEEGLGLIDWKTLRPTAKGEIIKNDLMENPGTQF